MKRWKIVWLVALLLVLTSCGTSVKSIYSSMPPLQPDTLHVTRIATIRMATRTYPEIEYVIKNAKSAQQLYQAALALPKPPKGIFNCPMDNGLIYQLDFLQGTSAQQQMTLQATGCQFIYLQAGSQDARMTDDAFHSLFLKTIGEPLLVPNASKS